MQEGPTDTSHPLFELQIFSQAGDSLVLNIRLYSDSLDNFFVTFFRPVQMNT